jgi:predicted NAD-dependent protein-ADP-ribosyltransferase YbiA (DUF1768 family)
MDRCSYFIKDKAMFGAFPTQEAVDELEGVGVKFFVNLTYDHEKKIIPYKTNYEYINYPIMDRKIPQNWKNFAKFIIKISNIILNLKTGECLYLHCKGGHGRSGVVVSCLLCYMFKIIPPNALKYTNICHKNRSVMREKWRKMGSPQTLYQKTFVHKFFEPLYFYKAFNFGHTAGFSNFSLHKVVIPFVGTFPTSEEAFHASKDLENNEYIEKQNNSKIVEEKISLNWEEKKEDVMMNILKLKISQHENIRGNLLNTGLRPIVEYTRENDYKGYSLIKDENILGKLLTKLRNELYKKEKDDKKI